MMIKYAINVIKNLHIRTFQDIIKNAVIKINYKIIFERIINNNFFYNFFYNFFI